MLAAATTRPGRPAHVRGGVGVRGCTRAQVNALDGVESCAHACARVPACVGACAGACAHPAVRTCVRPTGQRLPAAAGDDQSQGTRGGMEGRQRQLRSGGWSSKLVQWAQADQTMAGEVARPAVNLVLVERHVGAQVVDGGGVAVRQLASGGRLGGRDGGRGSDGRGHQ